MLYKVVKKIKIIATLGPATNKEEDIVRVKDKGVDFIRINMSHSSLEDMEHFLKMAKKVKIPFVIDTEGSQVRTGELSTPTVDVSENSEIKIFDKPIVGDNTKLSLKPEGVVPQLEKGDLIQIDFDTAVLRVSDTSTISRGYITAKVVTAGILGKNKAVVLDRACGRPLHLPILSKKDYDSIKLGMEYGVGHIALSFARSGKCLDEVRRATQNTMQVISKIECVDALRNLDVIIAKSDYLLIDRGDLSKEIPVEKIPFTQKIILNKAAKAKVPVFVATNLLETMINSRKPTRAEVHDILNTILDGAGGLVLAAETAIGKHPMECINMLNKLINHAQLAMDGSDVSQKEEEFVSKLLAKNYLLDSEVSSSLIEPHGGRLVNRVAVKIPEKSYLDSLPKINLDENRQRDVEQIAVGTYSPIEGFMNKDNFNSVLDRMRLSNGLVWSLPIFLDVSEEKAAELAVGSDVALVDERGEAMAILNLEEKYHFDKTEMAEKLYATLSDEHPGVRWIFNLNPVMLGGKITLLRRRDNEDKEYEMTPKQTRSLFEERGWSKVVAFHTRNVPHRGHEFIQMKAMEREKCDGLFVHPVVGKKKQGDFNAKYITKAYEIMTEKFYPQNRVIFGTFSTYSRYAGPREALFTALCRQNFGCSHFVVGRDHTGVKDFYHPKASHNIFDRFPDIGIKAVCFDKVFYSPTLQDHVHLADNPEHPEDDSQHISGTQARKMFEAGELPPAWFMRPEISQMIIDAVKRGEEVFVR
ncbi:sulfate adenylyltransferase [Candidatus Woesearchaeota archaeon CG10_big_fil_rev_8_21_14_0_10_45_16]|nr:MAG: sulfate adenylyltransferase [Candidatus Woesearchaeota archaeon CG10_big_fil_rev_8_21_14_0_10_45_16]